MHFTLFYDVVADYAERRNEFRVAHLEAGKDFIQRGELVLVGALADTPDQALLIFTTLEGAERFVRADPYVVNGLVKSYRIRKWNTVLGPGISGT